MASNTKKRLNADRSSVRLITSCVIVILFASICKFNLIELPSSVVAQTTTNINPTQDTYVNSSDPNANFGTNTYLYCGSDPGGSPDYFILMQFDVSGYSKLGSAYLYLRTWLSAGPPTLNIHIITSSWSQSTTTWNNLPSYDSSVNATLYAPLGWCSGDITKLVQAWCDGSVTNYGILIEYTNPYNRKIYGFSSDSGSKPYISLTHDVNPPVVGITGPSNGSVVGDDFTLSWTASDSDGTVTSCEQYVDGSYYGTTGTGVFSTSISGYTKGWRHIEIKAIDNNVNEAWDDIWVYYHPPWSSQPEDQTVLLNQPNVNVTWYLYDDTIPGTYSVYRNTSLIEGPTAWANNTPLVVDVNTSIVGLWNYTITYDDFFNSSGLPDTVWINVTYGKLPWSSQPTSQTVLFDQSNVNITWYLYDDTSPGTYSVYRNTSLIEGPTAWTNNTPLVVDVDTSIVGLWNYTIYYEDLLGNPGIPDLVWIDVTIGKLPWSSQPNAQTVLFNQPNVNVTWYLYDDTSPGTYSVYRNTSLIEGPTAWTNNTPLVVDVDTSIVGLWNYTIFYEDSLGNPGIPDLVWIDVTIGKLPWSSQPENQTVLRDQPNVNVTWYLYDDTAPGTYSVYCNTLLILGPTTWTNDTPLVVAVDTSIVGLWNYTIYYEDSLGNPGIAHSTWIIVYEPVPVISPPSDFPMYVGQEHITILWSVYDLYPSNFTVYQNNSVYDSGNYTDTIVVFLEGLVEGKHNFTCVVENTYGVTASDEVWVTVLPLTPDETPPLISSPENVSFEEGSFGYSIIWSGSDDRSPWWSIVWENETEIYNQAWIGNDIEISLDGLTVGLYRYNCTLFDEAGNSVSSIVFVTVFPMVPDNSPPTIIPPNPIEYEEGTTGHYLTWNCSDDHPYAYRIVINETELLYSSWHGENITVSVDGLDIGLWVVSLTLWDLAQNSFSTDTIVTVIPPLPDTTPPMVNQPAELIIAENIPGLIVWEVSDEHPGRYIILRNNSIVLEQEYWTSGIIQYYFVSLPRGIWEFNLTVWDEAGNSFSSIVLVKVVLGSEIDIKAPQISDHPDVEIRYGTTGNSLIFSIFDQHPKAYSISLDGVLVVEVLCSFPNRQVIYSLDGLDIGFYSVVITAWDIYDQSSSQTVRVTVTGDNTPPTIVTLPDFDFPVGHEVNITWVVFDDNPSRFEVLLLPAGEIILSGSWSGENILIDLSEYSEGTYHFRCIVYDTSGNFAFDDVIATISKAQSAPGFEFLSIIPLLLLIKVAKHRMRIRRRLKK